MLGAARVLLMQIIPHDVIAPFRNPHSQFRILHVLAQRDELHLGGDDALLGIPKLGDGMTRAGSERTAALAIESAKFYQAIALGAAGELGVLAAEIAIVHRLYFAAVIGGDILAGSDPFFAQSGKTFFRGSGEGGVAPRATAIIHADGFVDFNATVERLRRREVDLAHGHADVLVDLTFDVDATAVGQLFAAVGFEGFFGGDHGKEWIKDEG